MSLCREAIGTQPQRCAVAAADLQLGTWLESAAGIPARRLDRQPATASLWLTMKHPDNGASRRTSSAMSTPGEEAPPVPRAETFLVEYDGVDRCR